MKETLTKNLGGSAHDIAETIEHFKNDEILDTFNIDNENVESPTTQRKTRQQQQRRDTDQDSENGDFGSRRRNLKFRTLGSSDKPLGDREMLLKKKRASTSDLSGGANGDNPDSEDIGNGLFDRFSAARKTLTRGSTRRKKDDEDTKSLNEVNLEKKSSVSDWRSRLASKFKKSSTDQYEVNNVQENGEPSLHSYRKTSHELDTPMTEPTRRRTLGSMQNSRKISQNGEYDSEMVDGKYLTTVPILNPDGDEEEEGNVRPRHREPPKGLKALKPVKDPREDLIERLSRPTGSSSTDRKTVSQSNVFDRLSGTRGSVKKSVQDNRTHPGSSSGTTLTKIKDLTKNLRKNSKDEEDTNDHHSEQLSSQSKAKSYIAPKNSLTMFNDRSRPSGTLNGNSTLNGSKNSIHSSSKSLQQKDSPRSVRRATTSTLDNNRLVSSTRTTPARHIGSSTTNLRNANSKEDLSRSSSSASNSQQDLTKNIMKSTYSTPNIRSSPMRITSSATLTPASPSKARRTTPSASTSSFMKPTASSAKKLSSNIGSTSLSSQQPKRTTTSTVTRLTATRPSRR